MKAQTAPQQGTRGTVTTPSAASNCVLSCCCGDFQLENTRKFHIRTYVTNRWNCPSTVPTHVDTQAHISTCVRACHHHNVESAGSTRVGRLQGPGGDPPRSHFQAFGLSCAPLGLVAPSSVSRTQDRDACAPSSQGADFTPSGPYGTMPFAGSRQFTTCAEPSSCPERVLGRRLKPVQVDPADLTDGHTAHMYRRAGTRPRAGVPASCHPQSSLVSLLLPKRAHWLCLSWALRLCPHTVQTWALRRVGSVQVAPR